MLTLLSFHSGLYFNINVDGDTWVDDHHTTEDIGIVLGQLLLQLTRDKNISSVTANNIYRWTKR